MRPWLAVAVMCFTLSFDSGHCKRVRTLIAFGDSLTDNGNLFNATMNKVPLPKYYYHGRFSNAPGVWADQVSALEPRLHVVNFAYGGAMACTRTSLPVAYEGVPSLDNQVKAYSQKLKEDEAFRHSMASSYRIGLIWIGHNDLQTMSRQPPAAEQALQNSTISCITSSASRLLQSSFQAVVMGTLAPADKSPLAIERNEAAKLRAAVDGVNAGIRAGVVALQALWPNKTVLLWDINSQMVMANQNYKAFGFKYNSSTSCIKAGSDYSVMAGSFPQSMCDNADDFENLDPEGHPSAKAHGLIAGSLVSTLRDAKLLE